MQMSKNTYFNLSFFSFIIFVNFLASSTRTSIRSLIKSEAVIENKHQNLSLRFIIPSRPLTVKLSSKCKCVVRAHICHSMSFKEQSTNQGRSLLKQDKPYFYEAGYIHRKFFKISNSAQNVSYACLK